MKKYIYLSALFSLSMIYSCEDSKNIRYYNLNIELNEPVPNLKESDPLPDYLKAFINYTDTSASNDLLVPDVTFIRTDIKSANSIKPEPPLTWINKFRKGRDMLPSEYLKEDYNNLISKLVTPKLLTETKGKSSEQPAETTDYENNTFTLNIFKIKPDSVKALQDRITRKLLSKKGDITIKLEIVNKQFDQNKDSIPSIISDTLVKVQDTLNQKPQVEVVASKDQKKYQTETKPVIVSQNITANTFDEYLQKIGDPSIPYESKVNLKTRIVEKYFTGDDALVVFIGQNGNEVSHQNIKVFIEDLSQRNFKFTILDKKNSNNKINTLNIREQ